MIKVENLKKKFIRYENKKIKKEFYADNGITFEANDGEIIGILGPNGAGKTTTIKMITGILNADEGRILVDDKDIKKESISAKKTIGFVPDTPDIFLKLKGIEYLNFMGDIYEVPKEIRKQRIEELTKKFEIYDNLNEEMQGYSHGMRQKIILCGALLNNPKNWILDEPMTGLDPKASYDLKEMMRKHAKEGNCVFFSTHVLEVAEKLCDRVGIINKGKLIFVGTFEEMKTKLKDNGTLEELFLEITQDE